jgi:hypothetical protein
VLGKLNFADLNTMLTKDSEVLSFLVKATQDNPSWAIFNLTNVLKKLDPADLNRLLTSHGEVLNSLKKRPQHLDQVLLSFESDNLNETFREEKI